MQNIIGRYPVRNIQEMKQADNYFVAHKNDFNALDRRQYATELSEITKEAGYTPSDEILEYSGPRRGSITSGIEYRKMNSPVEFHPRLDAIEKIAEYGSDEEVLGYLENIDNEIGLNRRYHIVPDPVRTLFYSVKTASLADDVWVGDTDRLRQSKLEAWVNSQDFHTLMKRHFDFELINGMRENPWPIFSSLPDPHKRIIARMCNDDSSSLKSEGRSMYDIGGALDIEGTHQPASTQLERLDRLHGTKKDRIMDRLSRVKI